MNLPLASEQRAKVEQFRRKHRTALLTLLFTDIVGSTKLKQDFGDLQGTTFIQNHHGVVRKVLADFPVPPCVVQMNEGFSPTVPRL